MRVRTEDIIKKPGLAHFIKSDFLHSFLDGNLYLAHGPSFRKGGLDPGGRFDEDEGFIEIGNPTNTRIWIGLEKDGKPADFADCHELTSLVGKPKFHTGDDAPIHIFCLATIDLDHVEKRFDLRMAHGRDYILILTNPNLFIERFNKAVSDENLSAKGDFIEYIDDGERREKDVFFAKTLDYEYQKEYRIAVIGSEKIEHLHLKLGNLRDIVAVQDIKTGNLLENL